METKKQFTWDEINTTLMNKGLSPARISDILIELNKVSKEKND